jgi:predicted HD phosphohydrolase
MLSLADIADVFARKGHEQYAGEPVTQLEHALQTAHLAEQAGADDELITACLLHDLGHLLQDLGETPTAARRWTTCTSTPRCPSCVACSASACWAASGCTWTPSAACVPPCPATKRRCRPIRSAAWPCRAAPSAPNRQLAFMAQAGALDALQLRRWDDMAKTAGATTPPLQHLPATRRSAARWRDRRRFAPMALTWPVILAVLCGAALHASWNALVKSAGDKTVDTALVHFLGAFVAMPLLWWVGLPRPEAAPYIAASLVIHIGYYIALAGAYQHGELGMTYPIMRGFAPLLVALAAAH